MADNQIREALLDALPPQYHGYTNLIDGVVDALTEREYRIAESFRDNARLGGLDVDTVDEAFESAGIMERPHLTVAPSVAGDEAMAATVSQRLDQIEQALSEMRSLLT